MKSRAAWLVLLLVSSGCSSAETPAAEEDSAVPDDAAADTSADVTVAMDSGADTSVAVDTGSDATSDGSDDSTLDATVDSATDTALDAEPDATAADTSSPPDTGPDVDICATMDAAPDASSDASSDGADAAGPKYSVSASGDTVVDNQTGLTWQSDGNAPAQTWFAARDYCNALTLDGAGGFRIPRRDEIATLFDPTAVGAPYIDQTTFPKTATGPFYWTSTYYGQYVNYAWGIDFGSKSGTSPNYSGYQGSTATLRIRCVRGPSRYTVSASGNTVYDKTTSLTWQRGVSPTTGTVGDGNAYCASLKVDGVGCWRLPNIGELTTLFEVGVANPSIDKTAFPSTPSEMFWSSTISASGAGHYGDFSSYGVPGTTSAGAKLRFRCVR